jgi:hypothetical protein
MKTSILLILLLFFSPLAHAELSMVFKCNGSSPRFPNARIELMQGENGKLTGGYTMGSLPMYFTSWTAAGQVTTPPVLLLKLLTAANGYRETGIDPTQVKLFQNIFIDGNSQFEVNLWKLMDTEGKLLGWVGYGYREVIGCY